MVNQSRVLFFLTLPFGCFLNYGHSYYNISLRQKFHLREEKWCKNSDFFFFNYSTRYLWQVTNTSHGVSYDQVIIIMLHVASTIFSTKEAVKNFIFLVFLSSWIDKSKETFQTYKMFSIQLCLKKSYASVVKVLLTIFTSL